MNKGFDFMLLVFENLPIGTLWLLIVLFISTILVLSLSVLMTYKNMKCAIEVLMDKLKKTPAPMCVINLSKNKIVDCNHLMSELLDRHDLKNCDVINSGIFEKFDDYLRMKTMSKIEYPKTLLFKLKKNDKDLIIEAKFNQFTIGFKKYMLVVFIDNTSIINYIRYLGIFSTIIDSTPDGIIISKYKNESEPPTITYVNDSIANVTGYSKEELINKPLTALFELNVNEETLNKINLNIHSLNKTSLEYQYVKKSGEVSWVYTDIIPINTVNVYDSLAKMDNLTYVCKELKNKCDEIEIYITIHQKDITTPKQYEESSKTYINKLQSTIKDQIKLNSTIIDGLNSLINDNDKSKAIDDILKNLGKTLDVSRSYIFGIYDINGKQYTKCLHEWTNIGIEPEIHNTLTTDVTFEDIGAYQLYVNLISNKITKITIKDIQRKIFKHVIEDQNIKSLIICPIFNIDNKLVGFIGMDDCIDPDRIWDVSVDRALRGLSKGLGSVIQGF